MWDLQNHGMSGLTIRCHVVFDHKAASPWSKEDLLKPVNSNQYRYCAKHKFKQKHYMAGIFNYLKYYKENASKDLRLK